MTGAPSLALILMLAAVLPAGAQDRPPAAAPTQDAASAPIDEAQAAPGGERPPERPLEEAAQDFEDEPGREAEARPAPSAIAIPPTADSATNEVSTDAGSAGGDPDPAALAFGPPAPPVWFTLAESDGEFTACRMTLSLLGTRFVPQPPVTDPDIRDCGIARPIRVTEILPGVALTGTPVMRCATARSLALWVQGFLRPAAAALPEGRRLTALQTGPAYQCRDRVGTGRADPKPSEHGYGNAVDVTGFTFEGADPVPVQPRQGNGDPAESFLAAARGSACLLFATVLGPGSNAAHDDHLHLDIAARKGGWRLCE